MDRMKKYLLYIVLIIALAIISEFLIVIGLNSTYKQMINNSDGSMSQIEIYQAESNKSDGRIRGIIKKDENNPIKETYLKFDLYSDRGINMGSKYIEIDKTKTEQPFEVLFELNNVSNYKMSFVN